MPLQEGEYQVFRNVCPRNCYDTCSIKTYVKDGKIQFIEGAPESTFTRGGLCVKGYSYVRRVYSPDRIKYPMRKTRRKSGNWQRISWEDALETIAGKIHQLNETDGSLLGLCLATGSGNHGVTNASPHGMMSSLGYTTRTVGTPCWPAGIDAQTYDMGNMWCNDPEDLVKSRYIILWGVNPAWCSIHTMKYLYEARDRGAKIVTIDPIFTQTAAKSDLFWQIRPGTDGALALGMARHIVDSGLCDMDFLSAHSLGYPEFEAYLRKNVSLAWAAEECGIPGIEIARVAEEYASIKPATIWIGYGMQRHTNGGANVRAIDALGAMTGNIARPGGGVRYGHQTNRIFNYYSKDMTPPDTVTGRDQDRLINTNKLAEEILSAVDPAIQMMWVTLRNPFSQDFDRPLLEKAFNRIDFVVCVDQFFTQTTEYADMVLPVTTCFEEDSINVSYWHYWLGLNEKAIDPLYECKSNTEIAMALSRKMNDLYPGSCTFPTDLTAEQWINHEFNRDIYQMFGISSWRDLKDGPVKSKLPPEAWKNYQFATPSGKYEFVSDLARSHGHRALPEYIPRRKPYGPLRVLTPHSKFAIHSQFQNIDTMEAFNPEPHAGIHPVTAAARKIKDGQWIRVFNKVGELIVKARISGNVPKDSVVLYEVWFRNKDYCVQNLVDNTAADMGALKTGSPGVAIHDQFAEIEPFIGKRKT